MQNYSQIIPIGMVEIEKWSANGKGPIERTAIPNLVVNSGRVLMRDFILGLLPQASGISYHAWGTGSAIPTATNTALQYETGRKLGSPSGDGYYATFSTFYDTTEANGTAYEQGLFAQSGAAYRSANSGILVARVTGQVSKANTQNMRVNWRILIASATGS